VGAFAALQAGFVPDEALRTELRGSVAKELGKLLAHKKDECNLRRVKMAAVLFVRAKSQLDERELERRLLERRPRFHDVPGLVQKIYGRDEATGAVCGIYFFETQAALDAFSVSFVQLEAGLLFSA
jgi:hypothetical protein